MKNRIFAALLFVLLSCLAAGAAEMEIRYADVQAENDTETLAAREFARLVKEKSGGRIEVHVFPNGQLGDMKDIMQSVQMGAFEMCRNNPGWLADAGAPRMNIFTLPYLFRDMEHANKVIDGEIGGELLADIQNNGMQMVGLGYLEPSIRYFFFTKRPVASLADLKGLKIRVPTNALNTAMIEAFGASATPIAYNELYSSLQTGLVDGAENPLKGYCNMKFYEVAKYFSMDMHQFEPSVILVSEMFWNRLGEADRNIFREAMAETAKYFKDISGGMYDKYITECKNNGVTFSEIEDIENWRQAVQPLYKQFAGDYIDLVEKIQNTK